VKRFLEIGTGFLGGESGCVNAKSADARYESRFAALVEGRGQFIHAVDFHAW